MLNIIIMKMNHLNLPQNQTSETKLKVYYHLFFKHLLYFIVKFWGTHSTLSITRVISRML